jgi:hypothetical protein
MIQVVGFEFNGRIFLWVVVGGFCWGFADF